MLVFNILKTENTVYPTPPPPPQKKISDHVFHCLCLIC